MSSLVRTFDRELDRTILPAYVKPIDVKLYDGAKQDLNLNPFGGKAADEHRPLWVELHKYHLRNFGDKADTYNELWEMYISDSNAGEEGAFPPTSSSEKRILDAWFGKLQGWRVWALRKQGLSEAQRLMAYGPGTVVQEYARADIGGVFFTSALSVRGLRVGGRPLTAWS